jgi:hypothetical protein
MSSPTVYFDRDERYFPKDLNQQASFQNSDSRPEKAPETLTINYYVRPLDNGKTWIYYILFYLRDDGLGYFHVDAHTMDWEVVVVEMERGTPRRLCYTPHGRKEHFWLSEQDTRTLLQRTGGMVPIYCSKGKHATYPVRGTIWRYGGVASDTNDARIMYKQPRLRLAELSQEAIQGPYFAPKSGILTDPLDYPTVRLATVSTRLLFKSPW